MIEIADRRIIQSIESVIIRELSRIALLFRVFSRIKDPRSIKNKLERKGDQYSLSGKKIQDLFGIRVNLYFSDDSTIAQDAINSVFSKIDSTVDKPDLVTFGPSRCNHIYKLPEEQSKQSYLLKEYPLCDSTFEVQYRTVLSEGWHEVEHDLRYKCSSDWGKHEDLYRALNGIIATLESCDWSMLKIFEDKARRHYKSKEWLPMLKSKFRLRLQGNSISDDIVNLLNADNDLAKTLFRIDRGAIVRFLFKHRIDVPITPDNLIFICNQYQLNSAAITRLEPTPVTEVFESISSK